MSNEKRNVILKTDQYGLVAGTCKFFDLIKFTDERLPKQSNNHNGLSNGTLLMAMIINALYKVILIYVQILLNKYVHSTHQ